jgi:hypothetical protein
MALIETDHPAATGSSFSYWRDQLINTRIIIHELDKAILILERNEKESYTMNTGQSVLTVRRVNLPELIRQRAALLKQVQDIESTIETLENPGSSFIQVVPL